MRKRKEPHLWPAISRNHMCGSYDIGGVLVEPHDKSRPDIELPIYDRRNFDDALLELFNPPGTNKPGKEQKDREGHDAADKRYPYP